METAASFEVRNAPSSYPTAARAKLPGPARQIVGGGLAGFDGKFLLDFGNRSRRVSTNECDDE
jgi:hypothetical protein